MLLIAVYKAPVGAFRMERKPSPALLIVASKICYASKRPCIGKENAAAFCFGPQILGRGGGIELETAYPQLGKEVSAFMAVYTIIRVYEMPAESLQQATNRMSEAIVLHVERDFHVKDIVREPGAKPGTGKQVNLRPAATWIALALEQLGVKRKAR